MSEGLSQSPAETPRIVVVPQGEKVVRPDEVERIRASVRQLAWFLDSSVEIPGTRYRIGVDPLIGLIPLLGDLISMAISGYLVVAATRLGLPRSVVLRMLANLGIDLALGAIPVVGDFLDAAWKANTKNARLFERALDDPRGTARSSTWALVGLVVLFIGLTAGVVLVFVWLVRLLIEAF